MDDRSVDGAGRRESVVLLTDLLGLLVVPDGAAHAGCAPASPAREAAPRPRALLVLGSRLFGPDHGVSLDLPARDRTQDRPPPDFSTP